MPWKFVFKLWFYEVLQTTIVICLTIVVSKTSCDQRSQTNFHGIKYMNLIYIYLFIFLFTH